MFRFFFLCACSITVSHLRDDRASDLQECVFLSDTHFVLSHSGSWLLHLRAKLYLKSRTAWNWRQIRVPSHPHSLNLICMPYQGHPFDPHMSGFECVCTSVCVCVCVCVCVHVKYSMSVLCKFCSSPTLSVSPVARLRQRHNTQSHGLPGFKDLHCVRRRLRLHVRPHTRSGAHGPLCGRRDARLRPPRADQRVPCGHQRPTGTHALDKPLN